MRDFKNNKKNNFNRDDHRSDRRNFKNEKPARVRDRGYKNDEEDDEYLSNLIIGRNPVLEALKSDKQIDKVFVDDNAGGSIVQIIKLAKEKGTLSSAEIATLTKSLYESVPKAIEGVLKDKGKIKDLYELLKEMENGQR